MKNKTEILAECLLWTMASIGVMLISTLWSSYMYWQIVLTFFSPIGMENSNCYFFPEYRRTFFLCGIFLIVASCALGSTLELVEHPKDRTKQ